MKALLVTRCGCSRLMDMVHDVPPQNIDIPLLGTGGWLPQTGLTDYAHPIRRFGLSHNIKLRADTNNSGPIVCEYHEIEPVPVAVAE